MTTEVLVELDQVSKSFPSRHSDTSVLRDVDLVIRRRDQLSLVGPSGCGKSTLLSLIAGLLRPSSGRVNVLGRDMAELDDAQRARVRSRHIGIALQSDNLIPFLSARENVELALQLGRVGTRRRRRTRATELLDCLGVADRGGHRPRTLSGGETQRVALAVAMAKGPDLVLADEVVGQLDSTNAARVMSEVTDGDFAIIVVTHDRALAANMPRQYAISEQRLVAA